MHDNTPIREIDPLDKAEAVKAGFGFVGEIIRLIANLPERIPPRSLDKT